MIRDALQARWEMNLPAVLGEEEPISYAELAQRAAVLQAALPNEAGRQTAAILLPDGSHFLAALFAVLQAGWMAFPLNIHLSAAELSRLLNRAQVCAIITCGSMRPICEAAAESCAHEPVILCADTLRPAPQQLPDIQKTDPDAPMLLLASSGTTGYPKLVQLSEQNIAFNVAAYLRHMGYEKYRDPSPRYALGTPFSGIYGLLVLFSCILRGFPLSAMAEGFTLDALFQAAQEHGISHYDGGSVAAILLDRTLGRSIPYDITSLRYFGFGGSKVPDGTLSRLSAAYPHIRFWSGYGMTEASPLIAQPFRGLPADKLDSVGVPLPGVTVCLETEDGITDEPDQQGEIIVRGPNIMLGYYKDKKATEEILRGGFPSLCRQGLGSVATICLNHAAMPYGDAAIAAMGVVQRITTFGASAMIGFGQGFQPVCGFNYGARLYHRVKEGFWFCVKVAAVFLLVIGALGFAFAPQLIALFRDDPGVIAIGTVALRFQCVTFFFQAWITMSNMMLQTIGRTVPATFVAMARQGIFFIPLVWLLSLSPLGLLGVQMAQSVSDLLTLAAAVPIQLYVLRQMSQMQPAKV